MINTDSDRPNVVLDRKKKKKKKMFINTILYLFIHEFYIKYNTVNDSILNYFQILFYSVGLETMMYII